MRRSGVGGEDQVGTSMGRLPDGFPYGSVTYGIVSMAARWRSARAHDLRAQGGHTGHVSQPGRRTRPHLRMRPRRHSGNHRVATAARLNPDHPHRAHLGRPRSGGLSPARPRSGGLALRAAKTPPSRLSMPSGAYPWSRSDSAVRSASRPEADPTKRPAPPRPPVPHGSPPRRSHRRPPPPFQRVASRHTS